MKNKELLDIYSDYLISAFGKTTGTGLTELMEGSISHGRVRVGVGITIHEMRFANSTVDNKKRRKTAAL